MMWKDIGIGVLFGLFFAFQLVLFFFAFYPPATSLVDQVLISYSKDVVGPIFTGLGGAMLGAFAAYAFQKNSEVTREFNDSLRVLRIVKFQLLHKLSELVSVKKLRCFLLMIINFVFLQSNLCPSLQEFGTS